MTPWIVVAFLWGAVFGLGASALLAPSEEGTTTVSEIFLDGRHEQVKCYFNTATGATLFCEGMGQ